MNTELRRHAMAWPTVTVKRRNQLHMQTAGKSINKHGWYINLLFSKISHEVPLTDSFNVGLFSGLDYLCSMNGVSLESSSIHRRSVTVRDRE